MFKAWWHPFSRAAVIHGDPHLGNYTVFSEGGEAAGINLLDYGCVRIFHPRFVGGVVDLYRGLLENDEARIVHAYEVWGFKDLDKEKIEILNIWARFIYGPLLEDRTRTVADGVKPGEYGRRQAFQVHQALKERGPVTVPQEFVFMDRAAVASARCFSTSGRNSTTTGCSRPRSSISRWTNCRIARAGPLPRRDCRNRSDRDRRSTERAINLRASDCGR